MKSRCAGPLLAALLWAGAAAAQQAVSFPSVGTTDPTARADAQQRVPAFFAAYLKGR